MTLTFHCLLITILIFSLGKYIRHGNYFRISGKFIVRLFMRRSTKYITWLSNRIQIYHSYWIQFQPTLYLYCRYKFNIFNRYMTINNFIIYQCCNIVHHTKLLQYISIYIYECLYCIRDIDYPLTHEIHTYIFSNIRIHYTFDFKIVQHEWQKTQFSLVHISFYTTTLFMAIFSQNSHWMNFLVHERFFPYTLFIYYFYCCCLCRYLLAYKEYF